MEVANRSDCRTFALAVGIILLWLTPSLGQLVRYLGTIGAAAAAFLAALVIAAALRWRQRLGMLIEHRGPILLAVALAVAFAGLYPVARSGLLGPGSDRADALDVALRALLAGRPPYQTLTFLGNGPTPLPGALLLAAPFHWLGTSAFQNLLWGPLFAVLSPSMVGGRRAATGCVAALVLLSPAAMQDFVTGGDYLVNTFYVAIALWAVMRANHGAGRPVQMLAAAFFAIAISSRAIYAVEGPILFAWIIQHKGPRAGAAFVMIAGLSALALNGPLMAADPAHFPLFKSTSKLVLLPPEFHAAWVLPLAALIVASAAFFIKLTPARVYLISALALSVMLIPPLLWPMATIGPSSWLLNQLGFLLPVSIFGGLWLFSAIVGSSGNKGAVQTFSARAVGGR